MTKFFIWIILIYLLAFGAVWYFRAILIYPFDPTQTSPRAAGEPRLSAKSMASADGTSLVVWVARAQKNKPTILYFHGNAGNLAGRVQRFDRMLDRGYGVVAMAYRGSSGSGGKPSETAIMRDAKALVAQLPQLLDIKSVPSTLIYYGESLGSGVAIQLAKYTTPNAIILEAPFRSVVELAAKQMPFFPIKVVLDERWESIKHIKEIDTPVMVIHGAQDQTTPVEHGQSVFDAATNPSKQLHIMPNAGHGNLWSVGGQTAVYAFIDGIK